MQFPKEIMHINQKRGQVTLFIIIAIVIVVLGILIYLLYPQIKSTISSSSESPESIIQNCLQDSIIKNVGTISLQGGSFNPASYFMYDNSKIDYLCYTNEDYQKCTIQKSPLKVYIEEEINNSIKNDISGCFNSLKQDYEKRGYTVNIKSGEAQTELLPKRIVTNLNYNVTLTKGGSSEKHDKFNLVINNNLYELMSIASSIADWEHNYGDIETTIYMSYYKDLKVEKKKQSEGTTIYIITDRNTGNKFQFATRSIVIPAGY